MRFNQEPPLIAPNLILMKERRQIMYTDLREYLADLENRRELVRVKEEITDGHEIFSLIWELNKKSGPAVILENVKGFDVPVVTNIFGTMNRFASSCGFPRGLSINEYRDLFLNRLDKSKWIPPRLVKSGPCKEVILSGKEVDLGKFPILQWHPDDGGAYITLPIVIAKDDKFGRNAGIYRMMVHDNRSTGIMCNIFQDQGIYMGKAKKKGQQSGMPCAVAIGADPSLYIAAVTKLRFNEDEFAFASALRDGAPIDMVKCETIDMEVPASSEIVLEGEIAFNRGKMEGPFGEWMGYFEEGMLLPVFEVKCITHRRNPLYLMTIEGPQMGDAEILRMIPQIATFTVQAKERITGFVDGWLPPAGRNYSAFISIKKRYPGWGKTAIYQAFSMPYIASSANLVIVTDDDIDVTNPDDVVWALSTRVDPYQDVIITPPIGGYPLNPAGSVRPVEFPNTGLTDITFASKIGIDATLKWQGEGRTRPTAQPVKPREEILQRVIAKWNDYGLAD
ncbi:MAG: UbiD family decarboxylase [Desulfobacteraceae bacterium]|nr:MAG: UbiD family decarboxylase [Desulfobacteraceae bacterium]